MKTPFAIILAGLLACASPATAAGSFQLARVDGDGWVSPGDEARLSLFLFWDESCPSCVVEMAGLPALLSQQAELKAVAVYAGPRQAARRAVAKIVLPRTVAPALAPADPRGFMASLGNPRGALPFAALFDAQGRLCAIRSGALTSHTLRQALEQCQS